MVSQVGIQIRSRLCCSLCLRPTIRWKRRKNGAEFASSHFVNGYFVYNISSTKKLSTTFRLQKIYLKHFVYNRVQTFHLQHFVYKHFVNKHFVYKHFVYKISSTKISSTDRCVYSLHISQAIANIIWCVKVRLKYLNNEVIDKRLIGKIVSL
jgi:hypothetical protein